MNKNKWYAKIWSMERSFDMWSVNHFLLGTVLASIFLNLNFGYAKSLLISLVIMVLWEFWEIYRKMREPVVNRFTDVILGFFGFLFVHFLLRFYFNELVLLIFFFALYLILEIWGCWVFRKLGKRFI